MKIGKDTGSLMNWIMDNPDYHKPEVGEDVSELMWSDRHAWRVTSVDQDGRGATLTRYAPNFVGKSYGDARYEYEDANGKPLLSNETMKIRYRYKAWRKECGGKISLAWGRRDEYRDPPF